MQKHNHTSGEKTTVNCGNPSRSQSHVCHTYKESPRATATWKSHPTKVKCTIWVAAKCRGQNSTAINHGPLTPQRLNFSRIRETPTWAWTHELWDHDLSWSWMLNQLSHPGTPVPPQFWHNYFVITQMDNLGSLNRYSTLLYSMQASWLEHISCRQKYLEGTQKELRSSVIQVFSVKEIFWRWGSRPRALHR